MVAMIEHKGTFYAGAFIFLIPFLGFPTMWKMVLVGIAGFVLVISSLKVPSPRQVLKDKIKKESVISTNPVPELKIEIKPDPVLPSTVETPTVTVATPKIEVIVPKKKRVSTRASSSRKLNVQE